MNDRVNYTSQAAQGLVQRQRVSYAPSTFDKPTNSVLKKLVFALYIYCVYTVHVRAVYVYYIHIYCVYTVHVRAVYVYYIHIHCVYTVHVRAV